MAETRIREALELLDGGRRWFGKHWPDGHAVEARCVGLALAECYGYRVGRSLGEITDDPAFQRDAGMLSAVAKAHYPEHCVGQGRLSSEDKDGHITPAVWFNNHPDTTFADVELVMEKAAVMREEAVE